METEISLFQTLKSKVEFSSILKFGEMQINDPPPRARECALLQAGRQLRLIVAIQLADSIREQSSNQKDM